MPRFQKIFVAAPGNTVTGGPELLHQLVHELRGLGQQAFICYTPFDKAFETPAAYRHYEAPQAAFEDAPGHLLIVPEVSPGLALSVRRARAAMWWLAVDGFLVRSGESELKDRWRRLRYMLTGRRPWSFRPLRPLLHFAQSQYAVDFLRGHGIEAAPLSDYLNAAHEAPADAPPREAQIAYNPKKGKAVTAALMAAHPDLRFVPIANLSPAGVVDLLHRSALYIDFGHHPGKDRLPREAAMAGCCVVTGRRGSAANPVDIPIAQTYKLDERAPDFIRQFGEVARAILAAPEARARDFDAYRAAIRGERAVFAQQVRDVFTRD